MGWPYEHMYLNPYLTAYTKTQFILMVFLYVKCKTINLPENDTMEHFLKPGIGKGF